MFESAHHIDLSSGSSQLMVASEHGNVFSATLLKPVEAERTLPECPTARQAHLEGDPKGGYSNAPTSHLHECVVAQKFALERALP